MNFLAEDQRPGTPGRWTLTLLVGRFFKLTHYRGLNGRR
jgi:hypothetical protein